MKPGFEEFFEQQLDKNKNSLDTDLDGEIYADQLHSLLQRISPDFNAMLKPMEVGKNANNKIAARTDEQLIWDYIHGTNKEVVEERKQNAVPKMPSRNSGSANGMGGIFEGVYQGPKIFKQSIMTQTVRKPDGSYETRRIVRDADGITKTTVTKQTPDGKTETITSSSSDDPKTADRLRVGERAAVEGPSAIATDRNVYITKNGYAMPMNIW